MFQRWRLNVAGLIGDERMDAPIDEEQFFIELVVDFVFAP